MFVPIIMAETFLWQEPPFFTEHRIIQAIGKCVFFPFNQGYKRNLLFYNTESSFHQRRMDCSFLTTDFPVWRKPTCSGSDHKIGHFHWLNNIYCKSLSISCCQSYKLTHWSHPFQKVCKSYNANAEITPGLGMYWALYPPPPPPIKRLPSIAFLLPLFSTSLS